MNTIRQAARELWQGLRELPDYMIGALEDWISKAREFNGQEPDRDLEHRREQRHRKRNNIE